MLAGCRQVFMQFEDKYIKLFKFLVCDHTKTIYGKLKPPSLESDEISNFSLSFISL